MTERRKSYQCPDCGHIIEKGRGISLTPYNPITGKHEWLRKIPSKEKRVQP